VESSSVLVSGIVIIVGSALFLYAALTPIFFGSFWTSQPFGGWRLLEAASRLPEACDRGEVDLARPGHNGRLCRSRHQSASPRTVQHTEGVHPLWCYSAILALIQLFELWKSLTAFPGPTSSSRRARS
jgi:hypothetical protein